MLTSVSATPSTSMNIPELSSLTTETLDDNIHRLTEYLQQLTGSYEMECDIILKDHCYARPRNWRPENIYVKPIKRLFFSKNSTTG